MRSTASNTCSSKFVPVQPKYACVLEMSIALRENNARSGPWNGLACGSA